MAYRLCIFDAFGKITSVSSASYATDNIVVSDIVTLNPTIHAFVDESQLPTGELLDALIDGNNIGVSNSTGYNTTIRNPEQILANYDPRVEVTLLMENPFPYIAYGTRIVQDVTKAEPFYNLVDATTQPKHKTTQFKFTPSSGKFTRSLSGYTGGGIYVTNINKRSWISETAPHNIVGGVGTGSYAMEMFFYPTTAGLANNFTLMQKGPTGASAQWSLGFDAGAGFLQFSWQSLLTTGGYNYSQNIVNTAGISANNWNHVAVSVVKNGVTQGSYQIAGYFNGTNTFSLGVTLGTVPEYRHTHGIYIGNNSSGSSSFDGYIDSLRLLEQGNTTGLFGPSGYGFLPFGGGTLGVPTAAGFTRSSATCFLMDFNGVHDGTRFLAESPDYVRGTAMRITNLLLGTGGVTLATIAEVGVKDIVRYTLLATGATGFTDPTGFSASFGDVANAYVNTAVAGTSASYEHNFDYIFSLNSVYDNQPSLNVMQINYTNDSNYNRSLDLLARIEGIQGNIGSCGSVFQPQLGQNPFRRLFATASGNCYGVGLVHNSLFIDPTNSNTMSYIFDNGYLVTQGICAASYSFVDALGYTRTITGSDISNLRLDILDYQNSLKNSATVVKAAIAASASVNSVRKAKIAKTSGYNEIGLGGEELFGG
jgi:hypothetical protein